MSTTVRILNWSSTSDLPVLPSQTFHKVYKVQSASPSWLTPDQTPSLSRNLLGFISIPKIISNKIHAVGGFEKSWAELKDIFSISSRAITGQGFEPGLLLTSTLWKSVKRFLKLPLKLSSGEFAGTCQWRKKLKYKVGGVKGQGSRKLFERSEPSSRLGLMGCAGDSWCLRT